MIVDGRRRMVRRRGSEHQARLQGLRLHAHVGEHIDRRLLDAGIDRLQRAKVNVMLVRQAPRPEHRAGAENQRAADRVAKFDDVVGRRAVAGRVAVVEQIAFELAASSRTHRPVRPARKPLSGDEVPFVTEQARRQRRRSAGRRIGDRGVAPDAQLRFAIGDGDGVEAIGVDRENCPGQRVRRRPRHPSGRGEARIHERAGRGSRRVDQGVGVGVLVGDQGAVRVGGGIDARRETRLPISLVAAQEHQVDAGMAGSQDVVVLLVGPIFVVTAIHIDLVVEQQGVVGCCSELFPEM